MMNVRVFSAAVVLLAGLVATASAGERGNSISKSALGSMGFSSMEQMSDVDGLAIRGKGSRKGGTSAAAWGSGTANYHSPSGSATETTGYRATSNHKRGSSSALGGNIALAGEVQGTVVEKNGRTKSTISFAVIGAAGGSFASAH